MSRSWVSSTRFPGHVQTPADMWSLLIEGRDATSELPEGRWTEFLADPVLAARIASIPTRGGYLDDVKGFDAEFFSMSPREVDHVDPQQRIALELTWEALEHAHIPANSLKGERVGVFLGSSVERLHAVGGRRSADGAPVCHHRHRRIDPGEPCLVLLRFPRTVDGAGHCMFVGARRRSPGGSQRCVTATSDVAIAGGINILATPAGHPRLRRTPDHGSRRQDQGILRGRQWFQSVPRAAVSSC